ncbi:MAG: phosphodiester glycosidase family protein [Erysipelotrichaceae bacterium]|nr:phosphodiester glycosidase family protein [Erysipelotrichaceae bacterium]
MKKDIHTYSYDNGDIQKVLKVNLDSFNDFRILKPDYNKKSFDNLCDLYQDFIIKKYHYIFGKIVLFTLPQDIRIPFDDYDEEYGKIYDPLVLVNISFRKNIIIKNKKLYFKDKKTEDFYHYLEENKYLRMVEGDRNSISFMPVGYDMGFMSETRKDVSLKVNSAFFVMDRFDCATAYDIVGTPIGLNIKDGIIYNPPMFNRETLFVNRNNEVYISKCDLSKVSIIIDGISFIDKENCTFICRPEYSRSIKGGMDIVVVNNKVIAVKHKGNIPVPSGGYIIHLYEDRDMDIKDTNVSYKGFEDISFGIQVGNSVIVDGKKTEGFISSFSNIYRFWLPSYPPSLYPLDYEKDRAPRIVLGADKNNKPVLLWFEGAGKFGYEKGKDSCGASLKEVSDICEKLGLYNGINLDGGGSAQILINNQRDLLISDREADTFKEKERAVPLGLYIE